LLNKRLGKPVAAMVLPSTTTSSDVRPTTGRERTTSADFGSRRRATAASAAAKMQAALSSLGKLNAYELLPASAQEASLLPGQGVKMRKRSTAAKRRLCALGLVLPTLCLLAAGLDFTSRRKGPPSVAVDDSSVSPLKAVKQEGLPLGLTDDAPAAPLTMPAAPEPTAARLSDDSATEPAPAAEVKRWSCDHPRFRLPARPKLPPAKPVPYPAPPTACLLHLYTLAEPADLDPSLCDLTGALEPVDTTILFVNGTGDLFLSAYDTALTAVNDDGGAVQPARRHYTNMGELRFALRSVARNLLGGRLEAGSIRGLGSDYPNPEDDTTRLCVNALSCVALICVTRAPD
jgi:hypothetical protein